MNYNQRKYFFLLFLNIYNYLQVECKMKMSSLERLIFIAIFNLIKIIFNFFVEIIVSNGPKYIKGITAEKKLTKQRAEVNFLYFYHYMTKSAIAH